MFGTGGENVLLFFLPCTVNNLNQDKSRQNMLCVYLLKSDAEYYVG